MRTDDPGSFYAEHLLGEETCLLKDTCSFLIYAYGEPITVTTDITGLEPIFNTMFPQDSTPLAGLCFNCRSGSDRIFGIVLNGFAV